MAKKFKFSFVDTFEDKSGELKLIAKNAIEAAESAGFHFCVKCYGAIKEGEPYIFDSKNGECICEKCDKKR